MYGNTGGKKRALLMGCKGVCVVSVYSEVCKVRSYGFFRGALIDVQLHNHMPYQQYVRIYK